MTTYKKPLVITCCILLVLIAGEGCLRTFQKEKFQDWSVFTYQPDSITGYRYMPYAEGVFRNLAYSRHFSINRWGFPGADFSKKKQKGVYRILLVGTSDDTGLCTNGPLNYCNILDADFKRDGYKAEVINLSIDGSRRSRQCLDLIKTEGKRLGADLVLLKNAFPFESAMRYRSSYKGITIGYPVYGLNLDSAKAYIDTEVIKKDAYIRLYDNCYLYRYLVKIALENKDLPFVKWVSPFAFSNIKKFSAYVRKSLNWSKKNDKNKYPAVVMDEETSADSLKNLVNKLSEDKIKLITFDTYKHEADMQKFFKPRGISYFSLDVPRKEEYSFGKLDRHSSQEGHKAIAAALYKQLLGKLKRDGDL